MAVLWKREQYNGVGPDYETYREGMPQSMGDLVESYEKHAREIVAAIVYALPATGGVREPEGSLEETARALAAALGEDYETGVPFFVEQARIYRSVGKALSAQSSPEEG